MGDNVRSIRLILVLSGLLFNLTIVSGQCNHMRLGSFAGYVFMPQPPQFTKKATQPEGKRTGFIQLERDFTEHLSIGAEVLRGYFDYYPYNNSYSLSSGDVIDVTFNIVSLNGMYRNIGGDSNSKIKFGLPAGFSYRWGIGEEIYWGRYFWEIKTTYHNYKSMGLNAGISIEYFPIEYVSIAYRLTYFHFFEKLRPLPAYGPEEIEGYYPSRNMILGIVTLGFHI